MPPPRLASTRSDEAILPCRAPEPAFVDRGPGERCANAVRRASLEAIAFARARSAVTPRPVLALIDTLLSWLGPLFSTFGYFLVYAATLLESSAFLGIVVPGDVILAIGGIYAARGELSLPWVIGLGAVGTMCGESIGYWLGHRFGESFIRRLPFADRIQDKVEQAREAFDRNDAKVLLVGRFASGLRVIVPFTAGMGETSYRRFMMFVIPTATVWAVAVGLLGYLLGSNVDLIDKILSRFGWGMLALLVLILGGSFAWRKWRDRRSKTGSKTAS
jgi:membrane-associated protein